MICLNYSTKCTKVVAKIKYMESAGIKEAQNPHVNLSGKAPKSEFQSKLEEYCQQGVAFKALKKGDRDKETVEDANKKSRQAAIESATRYPSGARDSSASAAPWGTVGIN